jgi:hypothetical protein
MVENPVLDLVESEMVFVQHLPGPFNITLSNSVSVCPSMIRFGETRLITLCKLCGRTEPITRFSRNGLAQGPILNLP